MSASGFLEQKVRNDGQIMFRLEWNTTSQSIENNTSTISVSAYLVSTNDRIIKSSVNKQIWVYIDGIEYYADNLNISLSANQKKRVWSETVTIEHTSDGSRSFGLSGAIEIEAILSNTYYGMTYISYKTQELDTIPRATEFTITPSGFLVGTDSVSFTLTPASANFTHSILYSLDNSAWVSVAEKITETSYLWHTNSEAVIKVLAEATITTQNHDIWFKVETYSNNILIGSKIILDYYLLNKSYLNPTLSLDIVKETSNITEDVCVAGYTKITITPNYEIKYGAKITNYTYAYGEQKITQSPSDGKTIEPLSFILPSDATDNYKISLTISDSRWCQVTKTLSLFTVQSYSTPVINTLNYIRGYETSGEEFNQDDNGTAVKIIATISLASILGSTELNGYKYCIKRKNATPTSSYTILKDYNTSFIKRNGDTITINYTDNTLTEKASYTYALYIMDKLTTSFDVINTPASVILMNFKDNGRGMCIGGLSSEDDALEIKLKTYMTGGIQPIPIQTIGLNFNDLKTSGYYSGKIDTKAGQEIFLNYPGGSVAIGQTYHCEIYQMGFQEENIKQKVSYANGKIYYRIFDGTNWGEWQEEVSLTTIYNAIYPVGSIYMSMNSVDPSTLFTGTVWERWGAGRVPVGIDETDLNFASAGLEGGEKTHTLTVEEMPSHNHEGTYKFKTKGGATWTHYLMNDTATHTSSSNYNFVSPDTGTDNAEIQSPPTGGSQPHNNLQPYITCYMWKRIS